ALRPGTAGAIAMRRLAPWLWLYALGQVIGLLGVGLTSWGLTQLGRNVMPVLVFVVLLGLLHDRPREQSVLARAFAVMGLVEVVALTVGGHRLRSSGTFNNPNYAAHFLLCATVMLAYVPWRRSTRVAIFVLFAY